MEKPSSQPPSVNGGPQNTKAVHDFSESPPIRQETGNKETRPLEPGAPKPHQVSEEYLVFKENQDILNKEVSQKEIETELLRLEQYDFQISFNNYKGP